MRSFGLEFSVLFCLLPGMDCLWSKDQVCSYYPPPYSCFHHNPEAPTMSTTSTDQQRQEDMMPSPGSLLQNLPLGHHITIYPSLQIHQEFSFLLSGLYWRPLSQNGRLNRDKPASGDNVPVLRSTSHGHSMMSPICLAYLLCPTVWGHYTLHCGTKPEVL